MALPSRKIEAGRRYLAGGLVGAVLIIRVLLVALGTDFGVYEWVGLPGGSGIDSERSPQMAASVTAQIGMFFCAA